MSESPGLRDTALLYGCIAGGSVLGGVTRHLASLAIQFGPTFPWATLFVNVTGSFIIGFYAALSGPGGPISANAPQRHLVMTGFCGGYTTFSAFSLETLRLVQSGDGHTALLNIAASVAAWLMAAGLGHLLADHLNRRG